MPFKDIAELVEWQAAQNAIYYKGSPSDVVAVSAEKGQTVLTIKNAGGKTIDCSLEELARFRLTENDSDMKTPFEIAILAKKSHRFVQFLLSKGAIYDMKVMKTTNVDPAFALTIVQQEVRMFPENFGSLWSTQDPLPNVEATCWYQEDGIWKTNVFTRFGYSTGDSTGKVTMSTESGITKNASELQCDLYDFTFLRVDIQKDAERFNLNGISLSQEARSSLVHVLSVFALKDMYSLKNPYRQDFGNFLIGVLGLLLINDDNLHMLINGESLVNYEKKMYDAMKFFWNTERNQGYLFLQYNDLESKKLIRPVYALKHFSKATTYFCEYALDHPTFVANILNGVYYHKDQYYLEASKLMDNLYVPSNLHLPENEVYEIKNMLPGKSAKDIQMFFETLDENVLSNKP